MQEMGDRRVLNQIHEGMRVVDVNGDEVGKVRVVYLGGMSSEIIEAQGSQATSPAVNVSGNDTFIESIAEAFAPNTVPQELAERLLRNGYVLMDADGLFAADRFILPEQISGVRDGKVWISSSKDGLVRR